LTQIFCGNYAAAGMEHDELIALAGEIDSLYWKALCTPMQGCLFALTGNASNAVERINSGVAALRSAGTAFWMPLRSSYLGRAYAELGQFEDA
jgi:predicted ATPase